jgi:tetratricopeptide (TPR) repeat protein
MTKEKLKAKAEDYFYKGEYEKALQNFSLALMQAPDDKELQICAVLTDMANENEEKAQAIFEYYQITKEIEEENAEEIIGDLIESMDFDVDILNKVLDGGYLANEYQDDNSINYDDFIQLVNDRGSFKRAYEDIMFSTKVLINSKDDFIDFLDRLIDNNYVETAFSYADAAITLFPKDTKLQYIFHKIKEKKDTLI